MPNILYVLTLHKNRLSMRQLLEMDMICGLIKAFVPLMMIRKDL